jgi:hypothetical protein
VGVEERRLDPVVVVPGERRLQFVAAVRAEPGIGEVAGERRAVVRDIRASSAGSPSAISPVFKLR